MADNLSTKVEKLVKYGKSQLADKGVTSVADNIRAILNDISNIQSGSGTDTLQSRIDETKSCAYLFYNYAGTNPDIIKNLDTTGVTDMSYMFYNCSSLNGLTFSSNFDTSSITNMSYMFYTCRSLTDLDLSSFDTSRVTDMNRMFQNCSKLTNLDLSSFNTSSVTDMSAMFSSCNTLQNIIGVLDLISCLNVGYMFASCKNLATVTLKNIKVNLTIGSGTTSGALLDDPTIINTAKELWDLTGASSQRLSVSTSTSVRLDTIYVKLIDATEEMIANDPNITNKKPCEVCESTDEGAMTLREYIISKNWSISG